MGMTPPTGRAKQGSLKPLASFPEGGVSPLSRPTGRADNSLVPKQSFKWSRILIKNVHQHLANLRMSKYASACARRN